MIQLLLAAISLSAAPADAWPAFRGSGDSISQAKQVPLAWSEKSGVAWTAKVAGYGQSSPVIWRDRVFVTSAEGANKETALVACYDLKTGGSLWQKDFKSSETAGVSDYISRAAPTPAVDGARVYAFFEMGNLVALTHEGEIAWQRSLTDEYGKFLGNHGVGSSIALTAAAVVVLVDHDGPSYLLAVDKSTGKNLWKVDRPQKVSWSSPIVSGDQVIVSSNGRCEALDAKSGKQLWSVAGINGNTVPSATVSDKFVVVGSSDAGSNVAIRRDSQGDVTETGVAWRSKEASATFSSPLVYQGHTYLVNKAGVAFCLDAETGKTVWSRRIAGSCWASPLGACGRVYFFEKSGTTIVVAAGPEVKVLAENVLPAEDRVYGIAVVEGKIVVRTGSLLTCIVGSGDLSKEKDMDQTTAAESTETKTAEAKNAPVPYPGLPKAITSFGAAVLGDAVYVYGGHHGKAHHYYDLGQSGELLRLKLKDAATSKDAKWEVISTGPRLQGHALVAHGDSLCRVGGFEARNKETEEQNLWSVPDFVRFDLQTGKWHPMPPMPSSRSSFDAVVANGVLYVAGGWSMQGGKESAWQETALAFDFTAESPQWRELPKPPFQRRALALGTLNDKVYAIGGMLPEGKITRRTAIYDPAQKAWSEGPELPGEDMEGFGASCCALGDRLYVSTSSGKLLKLSQDGKSWENVQQLPDGRFFHRMLPVSDHQLILIGGASMQRGKYATVEVVSVK
jgi:outer membrane protein assembly factor BamB